MIERARSHENGQCNGKIEQRSVLAHVGRCEIHGNPPVEGGKAGIGNGGGDAVLAFPYGGIGQPDNDHLRIADTGGIRLDFNRYRFNPVDGSRKKFRKTHGKRFRKKLGLEEKGVPQINCGTPLEDPINRRP